MVYGPEVSRNGGFSFWGRTPIETVYTLILKAKKTGKVKFPSASVDVNGKVLKIKKSKNKNIARRVKKLVKRGLMKLNGNISLYK